MIQQGMTSRYILIPSDKEAETIEAYSNQHVRGGDSPDIDEIIDHFVEEAGPSDDPAGQGRKITGSSRLSAEDAAALGENVWITIVTEWPDDWVFPPPTQPA
jgi:hypothetical protein